MGEIIKEIFTADLATLFVIAGMLFLFIAVVGNITGKIEPGEKARIASGILGVIFISTGLAIHLIQKERATTPPTPTPSTTQTPTRPPTPTPPNTPTPTPTRPPALTPKPDDRRLPDSQSPKPSLQTQYPQVVAELTSFKQSGEFVTVELTLYNAGGKKHLPFVCPRGTAGPLRKEKPLEAKQARLVNQATDESWEPVNYDGPLWNWCSSLAPDQTVGAWMRYSIPDPGKKTFSFSLPILNGLFDNLRLSQNPTPTPPAAN